MRIIYYPDQTEIAEDGGPIKRFFKELQKKDPQLWSMVYETLKKK